MRKFWEDAKPAIRILKQKIDDFADFFCICMSFLKMIIMMRIMGSPGFPQYLAGRLRYKGKTRLETVAPSYI